MKQLSIAQQELFLYFIRNFQEKIKVCEEHEKYETCQTFFENQQTLESALFNKKDIDSAMEIIFIVCVKIGKVINIDGNLVHFIYNDKTVKLIVKTQEDLELCYENLNS